MSAPLKNSMSRMQRLVRSFARDTRGNFAIMTGLLLVPMAGLSGLALDHWAVSTAKSEIENAADAAALAIINRAAAVLREPNRNLDRQKRRASEEGRNAGNDQFDANVGKIPDTRIIRRLTEFRVDGLTLESKITWTAASKPRFSSLFRWNNQNLTGVSSASVGLPAYVQVHVLVDNSSSMGIGATSEAQDRLYEATHCAVACHLSGSESYNIARQRNILTRIDVVRNALINVAEKVTEAVAVPNQIKIGVYTFSNDLVPVVRTSEPEATNMALFKRKMESQLGLTDKGGGPIFTVL